MLSNFIYTLCILLATPYENLNIISNDFYYLDSSILQEIYFKKLFDFKWRKKIKSSFKNYHFQYKYTILERTPKFIKMLLKIKVFFIIESSLKNINSSCIYTYIILIEYYQNKFKFHLIIENEENPISYNYILNNDINHINNFTSHTQCDLYLNKISSIDILYDIFHSSNLSYKNNIPQKRATSFNIQDACSYAENYALNPNPNYKSFDGVGGDCTNFISQILYAGGIKRSSTWQPYTNAWIRAEELYSYLTSQQLGFKLPDHTFLDKGCLIQFYTPSIGKFFHNGFITYKLENNDYLYCCHSYNKLNYPLSEIYPNRYPTLRALKFI